MTMNARQTMPTAALIISMMIILGCAGGGLILMTDPGGMQVEVRQPGKAVSPATLTRGPSGDWIITTGSGQPQTPALTAAGHTWIAWVAGPALMAVGIIALAAKRWVPVIPTTAGTYAIAAGAGVMVLAIGLPSLPTWVWIASAIGLGAWLIVPGLISNLKRAKAQGAS